MEGGIGLAPPACCLAVFSHLAGTRQDYPDPDEVILALELRAEREFYCLGRCGSEW